MIFYLPRLLLEPTGMHKPPVEELEYVMIMVRPQPNFFHNQGAWRGQGSHSTTPIPLKNCKTRKLAMAKKNNCPPPYTTRKHPPSGP